jgi:hypothetical protein
MKVVLRSSRAKTQMTEVLVAQTFCVSVGNTVLVGQHVSCSHNKSTLVVYLKITITKYVDHIDSDCKYCGLVGKIL